jgi:protein TonB
LDVKPPRILKFKQAVYPKECIREGIRGMVILEVSIDKDGKAIRARVISSPDPRLSRAAAEAVKDYEFSPALVGGKPVESRMLLKVYF